MIRAWCLKWGAQPSDADDVAQQVLIKLMTAMKTYQLRVHRQLPGLAQDGHAQCLDRLRPPPEHQPGPDWISPIADSHDALADLEQQMEQAFERELLELAMQPGPAAGEAEHLGSLPAHLDREPPGRRGRQPTRQPVSSVFVAKHRVLKLLEEEARTLRTQWC